MAKIAVIGHGVVGSGVVELCMKNKSTIKKRAGQEIVVKRILDLREFNDLAYSELFTKEFNDILNDDEISVVAEVMGGVNPAFEFTKNLLMAKKSVVTSNKELVAQKGTELLEIAKQNNVNYFFEASVGGGIPIIRPIHTCLAANQIQEIAGILNGTTNFILTKMITDKMSFENALLLAQKLGYAERNPEADVEGHDACRKICILASIITGKEVNPDLVHTTGITNITLEDVSYASNWGGVIKLIGRAKILNDGNLDIMVSPAFIKNGSQLASIDDVFNGVLVRGDATGDVVFYGKGAGKLPTASAVVADIIDAAKLNKNDNSLTWKKSEYKFISDYKDCNLEFYIRCVTDDKEKAYNLINKYFSEVKFLANENAKDNEIAFVTEHLRESYVRECIKNLEDNNIQILSKIRVLDY